MEYLKVFLIEAGYGLFMFILGIKFCKGFIKKG
jgi:hypothetical protein